jgi:Asp-tRNA(Asn)/Glu-tRNA(Gln) amidotransferase C subunit
LRDDTKHESLAVEKVLQNGPVVKKNFFAVPKVIG